MAVPTQLIGLVPAAGRGTRLGGIAGSKEMVPVPTAGSGASAPVSAQLLRCLAQAGVERAYVMLRTPHVVGVRRIRPSMLVAGDTGTVDLDLQHRGAIRSTRFDLHERVRRANMGDHVADLIVEPMAAGMWLQP